MIRGSEARECLISAGFSRVAVVLEEGECVSLIAEIDGRRFIVSIYRGSNAYCAKIVPEEQAPTSSCTTLLYYPQGLYAFSKSLRGLCTEVVTKAKGMRS